MEMAERFTQDQGEGSTTSTIVEEKFMSQNNSLILYLVLLLSIFSTSVQGQSFLSDQYGSIAQDYRNQSKERLTKFEMVVNENVESMKYIGKDYLNFFIQQVIACENSLINNKKINSENINQISSVDKNLDDVKNLTELSIKNIANRVAITKTNLDRACPSQRGDFNAYIQCVSLTEKYNYQVMLEFEAKATHLYFYQLISDSIIRLRKCIVDKGAFIGLDLNGSNNSINNIKKEVIKQNQKISNVSIGLM